jgi:hypothetical protein
MAFAVPGFPVQIWGAATINGLPAPDGTQVSAKINGVDVAITTTSGGIYDLIVSDTDNTRSGSIVTIFVNNINSGKTVTFAGGSQPEINLGVTVSSPAPESTSGGGGGGGGGYIAPKPTNVTNVTNTITAMATDANIIATTANEASTPTQCTERWLCTDWILCSNGLQNRTCEDMNKCGSELYRPMESQPCSTQDIAAAASATGMLIASPELVGGIIAIIVVIAIIAYLAMKSKKKGKSPVSSAVKKK